MIPYDKHMPQPSEIGQDLRERGYDAQHQNYSASERRLSAIAQAATQRGYTAMIRPSDHCVVIRGSLRSADDELLSQLGIYWERIDDGTATALIPKEQYGAYRGETR